LTRDESSGTGRYGVLVVAAAAPVLVLLPCPVAALLDVRLWVDEVDVVGSMEREEGSGG
jgi:hypothetical protein